MERWFAVRIAPGGQRIAAQDAWRGEDIAEQHRYEFLIEKQCRKRGFETFTPSFWLRTKHARTKRLLVKRFAFMTGYCFVNLPAFQFEKLRRDCNLVSYIVRDANGPTQFPSPVIDELRINDFKERVTFQLASHKRDEQLRLGEIQRLRGDLRRMIMPKGRAGRVNIEAHRKVALDRLPERTRERVLSLMAQLKALDAEPLAEFAEAV